MALPETIVVRRKDIMDHLGISRRKFYDLIKCGHIRQNWMNKIKGKPTGNPVYLREDVLKVEELLRG